MTPEQRRLQLFASVTRGIHALAQQQPVMVALDDLQWSDAASNALLRYVAIHSNAAPLLIIGAFRSDEATSNDDLARSIEELHRRRLLTTIRIGPLTAAGTAQQVAAILGAEDRDLAQAIHRHCEGNPFFVEEVLWTLADPDPAPMPAYIAWADEYWAARHSHSAGGGYVNFLMEEVEERVAAAYRENYSRLKALKQHYDPANMFRVNQNIPPGG